MPEGRRWGQPLADLYPHLKKQAWTLQGGWAWAVLPHGALVAVRMTPDFHTELRISHKDAPTNEAAWKKWATELATFLEHCEGRAGWEVVAQVPGKADTTFRQRLKGEIVPETCVHCGAPATKGPYKEPVCTACATRLGTEEADARRPA